MEDEKRLRMVEPSYYLTSPREMEDMYRDLPEAVTNTQLVADMCDLDIDFTQLRLPRYDVPDGPDPVRVPVQYLLGRAGTPPAEREREREGTAAL